MQNFSPREIIVGGCLLAFGASFLNTGFLIETGTSVSHLTGDVSRLGAGVAGLGGFRFRELGTVSIAALGFVTGSTVSGYLFHHPQLEMRMPYGRTLSVLGLCLCMVYFVRSASVLAPVAIASAVCGAQNALASRYRGLVLRTTHLTGLMTDLGIHLGMKLRGHVIEDWKILVPLYLVLGFLAGATVGGWLVLGTDLPWLLFAGAGYMTGGAFWSVYKRTRHSS